VGLADWIRNATIAELTGVRAVVGKEARHAIDEEIRRRDAPKPKRLGVPNETEARYLEWIRSQPGVVRAELHAIKIRLASGAGGAWYTPDIFVETASGRDEIHETKGWQREAARVRVKVAARLCPWWRFVQVRWIDGEWRTEEIGEQTK
jgi:hypothetical protein